MSLEPSRANEFIFRASELSREDHLTSWPATEHDTFDWIGPREVNLNDHSVWCGADHAFILNMGAAERMGVVAVLSQARTAPPGKATGAHKALARCSRIGKGGTLRLLPPY